jgi:hypothetical protein
MNTLPASIVCSPSLTHCTHVLNGDSGRPQVGDTLSGSMFMPWYLRSFGARVGRNLYFDSSVPTEVRIMIWYRPQNKSRVGSTSQPRVYCYYIGTRTKITGYTFHIGI